MSTRVTPLFLDRVTSYYLITFTQDKDRVGKVAVPVIQKLGALPETRTCLPSANTVPAIDDVSQALRAFNDSHELSSNPFPGMQGRSSFAGLTTPIFAVIGAALGYDCYKKSSYSERIGDREGAQLAKLQAVESVSLAAGSTAIAPLRGISMVQDIARAATRVPFVLNSATTTAQSVFSWASSILYIIFYVLNGVRYGWKLANWCQGRSWRQELLASDDPIKMLMNQLQQRVRGLNVSSEEYKKLALDAGARWLERVAKEAKQNGKKLEFKDPRVAFERYIQLHPEVIESLLGKCPVELTWEGELVRLGQYLAIQNECAKFEADCERKLGSKTVEALKTQDTAKVKEALTSKEGMYLAVKIGLAVIGLVTSVTALVLTGGVGLAVMLVLYGIGALIAIYLEDWGALKEQLETTELSKKDRFFIYFSTCLSVLAVGGLIASAVLSGGATAYLAALILTSAWLIINLRSMVVVWKHDSHPWMARQPTIAAFRALLQTQPSQELLQTVFQKMSKEDQETIASVLKKHTEKGQTNFAQCIKDLQGLEQSISQEHQQQRKQFLEDLQEAIDTKQFFQRIVEKRIQEVQAAQH